jgi:hypothetical protein
VGTREGDGPTQMNVIFHAHRITRLRHPAHRRTAPLAEDRQPPDA